MNCLCLRRLKIFNDPKRLAYMSVVGAFLVHFSLGSIYTYGNMAPYIIQYLNNCTATYGTINAGNSMWIFGLAVFGLGASMSLGGYIETKLGPVLTVLLGSWIMSFGVLVTAATIKVHLAMISISYGLIAGLGTGIAYGVSLSIPSEWFPQSKGFVSGIIVAGFGLGPMLFDFIQSYIINPNLYSIDLKDLSRVPTSFIVMGSVYAVLQLIGSMMISRPKETVNENDNSHEGQIAQILDHEISIPNEVNITPYQLIYELDFWILWITYALNSCVAVLVISLHKVYGKTLNFEDSLLLPVTAIGALCNGVGRIAWGYFNDKISYKILMSVLSFSMSLVLGTFYTFTNLSGSTGNSKSSYILYFIWVIILHILLSGNFSLFPSICVKTFGLANFTWNYGMLFSAYSFSGILTSSVTTNLLVNNHNPKAYLTPFLIGCGFSFLAGLVTFLYRGKSLLYKNLNI